MTKLRSLLLTLAIALLTACGGGSAEPKVVVMFGDSLTDNNGEFVTRSQHWVEKIKAQITANGLDANVSVTVVNEGIGGENSQEALDRLPGVLAKYKPSHIVLTHGTNDISPTCPQCAEIITRPYLEAMAQLAKDAGVRVIMGEFTLKAYGSEVQQAYSVAYQKASQNSGSTYVHLVAGIPYDLSNYQFDGIHFTDGAQEAIKNNLAAVLFPTF
jgi:acyl-CoA thioesterase-1